MQANKYLFLHDAKNGVYCETRETSINSSNRTKKCHQYYLKCIFYILYLDGILSAAYFYIKVVLGSTENKVNKLKK